MGEHRPEPLEGFGRDAWTELRHVALEVGADEVVAQHEALGVRAGQEAVREASAKPEGLAFGLPLPGLEHVEGAHVDVGDAAGEALARLAEQVDRGRAQHQEPPITLTMMTALVDQAATRLKQLGYTVNLVEDDQAVLVGPQEKRRVAELVAVRAGATSREG
jgi:hypothetical protein